MQIDKHPKVNSLTFFALAAVLGIVSVVFFATPLTKTVANTPIVQKDEIGEYQGRFTVGYRQNPFFQEYYVVKFGNEFRHYKVDPFSVDTQLQPGMLVMMTDKTITRMVRTDTKELLEKK